jgi:hypothetical protein
MNFARLACAFAIFAGTAAYSRTLTREEKTADLEQLASIIKSQYGPFEYKKALLKIDVDALVKSYAAEAETVSNLRFYHLLNRFVAEFQDSHFRSSAQVNYLSTLGFVADRINGAVLIDRVNPEMLPEQAFPFERGDEILEMDGRPINDVLEDLARYLPGGYKETRLRMAATMIGHRPASVLPPEKGYSRVTIRRGTSTIQDTVRLPWYGVGQLDEDGDATLVWNPIVPNYEKLSVEDVFEYLPKGEQAFRCSGMTRTSIPKGATILTSKPFVSYYHPTEKGNVGYLRIPHYSWDNESELRFKQYEYVVSELEKNTVGLIIDQDHNCGGSVFFLEQMVGLFADKPYKGLEFEFLASRAEYLDFKNWVDAESRFTLEGKDWLGVVDLVRKAWQNGDRMSPRTTFNNNRELQPNGIRYTKPIVMLVDEMSGSGGDAFPAMMQGLKRATLMGVRTMGAGGHVQPTPNLNYSSNRINITKSMFFRPDGVAVENNGAVPDIAYQPTRDDFLYQYRNYQKRYLEELLKLVP